MRAIVDLAVAEDVVIIPFGGGTNISGSLEPPPEESPARCSRSTSAD